MRRALRDHRRDFVAIVGLVVLAGRDRRLHPAAPAGVHASTRATTPCRRRSRTPRRSPPARGRRSRSPACRSARSAGSSWSNGRAVVTMNIFRRYAPIYRDATVLLRPRTPLKDMYLALDPGTKRAGAVPRRRDAERRRRPRPTVDLDQILASLDADTRSYLLLLLSGGAQAFRDPTAAAATVPGPGAAPSQAAVVSLSGTFKRFAPLDRDTRKFATLLAARNANLRTAIHNLQRVATALGGVDGQLASLIVASNTNFSAISSQDANLKAGLTLLPGHAHADQPDARARCRRSPLSSARRCSKLRAVRPRARARAQGLPSAVPRHHAGDREPAAAVLDRRATAGQGAAARRHEAREGDPAAHALGRRAQHAVQHARLPAQGQRAGLPVLGLVAGPHRVDADRACRTPTGRACAGSSWRPARS